MWLYIYPRPMEIMYGQVSQFIVRDFNKTLIEKGYRITSKPSTSVNLISDAILERIHQVLGNLVRTFIITQTYVDKDDP